MTHFIPAMSRDQLTAEIVRDLLEYKPDGSLVWKKTVNSRAVKGSVAGGNSITFGYKSMGIGGVLYRQHHIVWLYHTGAWPEHEIDHINGNRADNRIENLRDVPRRTNSQNERKPRSNNTTGFMGVKLKKKSNRFGAQIRIDGKKTWLGSFATAEEAANAYLDAKRKHHAGCTI